MGSWTLLPMRNIFIARLHAKRRPLTSLRIPVFRQNGSLKLFIKILQLSESILILFLSEQKWITPSEFHNDVKHRYEIPTG